MSVEPENADYLRIEDIYKDFDGQIAVDKVNLSIHKGEIFALLGASGCGKSTLLRILAGFEHPTNGSVYLEGKNITNLPAWQRPINMMFQSYALFPHMTVENNIAFGLKQGNMSKDDIRDRVSDMLNLVQMSALAKRKPHQLSGGQQQRVALARSLAKNPKLLLLDEPMAALDKKLRLQMQTELVSIVERLGVTCVMVTHDQDEAMSMAHRIAIMHAGSILQTGTASDIYEQPNCRYTAEFIGSINIIDDDKGRFFAIRPEKMHISKNEPQQTGNKTPGVIKSIAYFGSHSVYHIYLPSGTKLLCNVANMERWTSETFSCHDQVWLSWQDNSGILLTS